MGSGIDDAHVHSHVFLGAEHQANERRAWGVIALCTAMMIAEIAGGLMFGSIALVADGIHMSTHAGALLLAALAYTYARRHAHDPRFTLGTGKLGDLAGFGSAIMLTMIALLIAYESVSRLFAPVPIHFAEAIPIAAVGLAVNIASAWLLSGGKFHGHRHAHPHGHGTAHDGHEHEEARPIATRQGKLILEIFEEDVPPRFRLYAESGPVPAADTIALETLRPEGVRQSFTLLDRGGYLESAEEIPEPHAFTVRLVIDGVAHAALFEEHSHAHGAATRDYNMRAAVMHVVADAAVSVMVIVGLTLARALNWLWIDPAAGIVGAAVIASWAYSLIRDTGAVLLDMTPDPDMARNLRDTIEDDGDRLSDFHLWRLGPGHLGAILSITTTTDRDAEYYRARLARFRSLSHLTIEVQRG